VATILALAELARTLVFPIAAMEKFTRTIYYFWATYEFDAKHHLAYKFFSGTQ
jgi:hypothetical protein